MALARAVGRRVAFAAGVVCLVAAAAPATALPGVTTTTRTTVTAMTYNIHEADIPSSAGAPWSQRRAKVAALINGTHPNLVAVQEAAAWVAAVKGPRQIDDLVSALGGTYRLARTEVPPTEKHYFRTADYILYDPNVVRPVGTGDHWDLGHTSAGANHWAVHQEFTDITTGARFVFVCFHLHVQNNHPATDDQIRQDQTVSMLNQGHAYAAARGVPVFYAGDTNSVVESKHQFDGPRVAMRARHIADAFDIAQSRSNVKYDTANDYERKPPAFGKYIDGVFLPAGAKVTRWRQIIHLKHGRFVGVIPSDHNPVVATVILPN